MVPLHEQVGTVNANSGTATVKARFDMLHCLAYTLHF